MSGKIIKLTPRRKPKVKICIPYYESLCPQIVELGEQLITGGIPGYDAALWRKEGTIIQFLRNQAIDDTPELDWDFLFFIDDDIGFPIEDFRKTTIVWHDGKQYEIYYMVALIKQILDHNLNICGGYYTARANPYLPLVYKRLDPNLLEGPWIQILKPPDKGMVEVDAIATGFLCIKRNVFEAFEQRRQKTIKIRDEFEKWKAENLDKIPPEVQKYLSVCKPEINSPFWIDSIYDPTNQKWVDVGEDIYFCREAQKLGFKIYCDFSVGLGHLTHKYQTPEAYKHAFMADQVNTHLQWAKEQGRVSPIQEFIDSDDPKEVRYGG